MLRTSAFVLVTSLLIATTAQAQAPTQALPETSVAAERLDAIFAKQASHAEFGRWMHGIGGIALGGAGMGVGAWLMLDDSVWDNRDLQLITGGLMLGMGTVALTSGIYSLVTPTFSAERYERFRLAYADGLSEREVGQFEGELRLDAERARFGRQMHIVTGFAKLVGGLGIVVATAAATTTQGQEHFGYIAGGTIAGLGLLTAIKSLFCRSAAERAWESYLNGDVPQARASVQVDVAPIMSPQAGGVSVVGSF
jgi:hypothetical protein